MKTTSLLIFLIYLPGFLVSQNTAHSLDNAYGLDQTLYNGKKYNYFLPIGTKGNQYLLSPLFINGSLTLRGKEFFGVSLNYDIFNQQLLLKYKDEKGSTNILEVSKAWIKSFSLGNMHFEYLDLEKKPQYYQVIGKGQIKILYFWRKTFDLEGSVGSYYFTFSAPIRDSFILMNGKLSPYNSNHYFLRAFDPSIRPLIKKYLHKNKIRVKKSSDQAMEDAINFIEGLK